MSAVTILVGKRRSQTFHLEHPRGAKQWQHLSQTIVYIGNATYVMAVALEQHHPQARKADHRTQKRVQRRPVDARGSKGTSSRERTSSAGAVSVFINTMNVAGSNSSMSKWKTASVRRLGCSDKSKMTTGTCVEISGRRRGTAERTVRRRPK
jgi:hypothetical protein